MTVKLLLLPPALTSGVYNMIEILIKALTVLTWAIGLGTILYWYTYFITTAFFIAKNKAKPMPTIVNLNWNKQDTPQA